MVRLTIEGQENADYGSTTISNQEMHAINGNIVVMPGQSEDEDPL